MNNQQISIVCVIQAKPETKEHVLKELTHLAELTRKEEGNINYDLHLACSNDCLFLIYENWIDQQALDQHMDQDYLKAFLSKEEALLETPIKGTICQLIK